MMLVLRKDIDALITVEMFVTTLFYGYSDLKNFPEEENEQASFLLQVYRFPVETATPAKNEVALRVGVPPTTSKK